MSHVFISYSHKDSDKRKVLVSTLKDAGFRDREIWYDDKDIQGGDDWRDEIETALEESFAIVVIVTPAAMNSTYVTYEWSWGIGNGKPVIPIQFGRIDFKDVHSRLSKLDFISLAEAPQTLREHQTVPSDIFYLNRVIADTIMPLGVLARVTLWLYQYTRSDVISLDIFESLMTKTRDEARILHYQTLPELMVDKSCAFTTKQIRSCRKLVLQIASFWETLLTVPLDSQLDFEDQSDRIAKVERQRVKLIQPLLTEELDLFRPDFQWFDNYLDGISNKRSEQMTIAPLAKEALKYLANDSADLVWEAIKLVRKSKNL